MLVSLIETLVPVVMAAVGPEIKADIQAVVTKYATSTNVAEQAGAALIKTLFGL